MPDLSESRYPGTGDMPEMGAPQAGTPGAQKAMVQSNPVISALQTIQTWLASMEQKNVPGIQEFKQKFIELLQLAAKMGGGTPGAQQNPPGSPSAPGAVPTASGGNVATATLQQGQGTVGMPQSRNAMGSPTAKPMI